MFINFGFNNIEQYNFKVKLGDVIIQNQTAQIPSFIAQQQFMQIVNNLAQDDRPMMIKVSKKVWTDKDEEKEESLMFENNAYVRAFGEED